MRPNGFLQSEMLTICKKKRANKYATCKDLTMFILKTTVLGDVTPRSLVKKILDFQKNMLLLPPNSGSISVRSVHTCQQN